MSIAKAPKKILVRAPNWIGDAVMSLPAVASLKALCPCASISVLTKTRAMPVFENNSAVEAVIEYDDKGRHAGVRGRVRLAGEIKRMGFSMAVLFQNAFDAAFIAYLASIPERIGYARDLRSALLTKAIPATAEIKKKHQVYYYLNIVKELGGVIPEDPAPHINISKEDEAWAEDFLRKNRLTDKPLAGASPGASYGPAKRWPTDSFADTLKKFSSKGFVPIIFGASEDAETCKLVSEGLKGKHLNLAGGITLRHFMALLKRLRIFITNDSGPMHIASALGVPTIVVFGSTDPALTGPMGKNVKVVMKKTECSPCFERECKYKHYKCLTAITPQDVYGEAERLIEGGVEACRIR